MKNNFTGSTVRRTANSVSKYLRPLSSNYRSKVKRLFLERHGKGKLDDVRRKALEMVIFEIENDLEHRSPLHEQVKLMRYIRNVLLDDIGENETHPNIRYPQIERIVAIIREKRRTIS